MKNSQRAFQVRGRRVRSDNGISLTELMVSSVLISVTLAVVVEMVQLCVFAYASMTHRLEGQSAASIALERIKRDVRQAVSVESSIKHKPEEYPSENKALTSQTLILHLPILYLDRKNDPLDPQYSATASNSINGMNLDSSGFYEVVYDVVPDPDRPGEYVMQMSCERHDGTAVLEQSCSYRHQILRSSPQRILSGIVGPLESNAPAGSPPRVFSYISKRGNSSTYSGRLDVLKESALWNSGIVQGIQLVGLDLEVRRTSRNTNLTEASVGQDKTTAIHAEVGMRCPLVEYGVPGDDVYENANN